MFDKKRLKSILNSDLAGILPAPIPARVLTFKQLNGKINAALESKKIDTLDESIRQAIQYYSKVSQIFEENIYIL